MQIVIGIVVDGQRRVRLVTKEGTTDDYLRALGSIKTEMAETTDGAEVSLFRVFTYPAQEENALGRARQDLTVEYHQRATRRSYLGYSGL